MADQTAQWGDCLAYLLAAASSSDHPKNNVDVQSVFHALFETFSSGRTDLVAALASGVTDEEAYHGNSSSQPPRAPLFSSR
jgi:hypothetical protein